MTVETETVTSIPQVAVAPAAGKEGSNGSLRTKPSSETIRPKKDKKKLSRKQPSVTASNASSKADIFEAKVASAVDEANTSDSEETFVYDSNPPDGGDRPRRFHSRTPSATSMVSQVDRNGMRSIHSVMEGAGPSVAVKKNMKFVSTFNGSGNDSGIGDDETKGTGRSNAGSGRGTSRGYHHHIGRWGRSGGGNGHTSLFDNEAPFHINAATVQRSRFPTNNSRQSSGPPSPRFNSSRGAANGKRGLQMASAYDMDDTTGADDERTPLIQGSMRSGRSGRSRRHAMTVRALEGQDYRGNPSFLNRFASCLVLTVMLLLVVSGAIGFMFATSQPLTDIELVALRNVVASEQELMLDVTVKAHNPNVVVVIIDSADVEVFAKSPHAGTDSEWWRRPHDSDAFAMGNKRDGDLQSQDDPTTDPPLDDTAPNMRLGTIREFDSPLSFEGSFFHQGISASTGEVRLKQPGNGTDHGTERWERILQDEFDLILKGVLKYSLPLSQRIRSVAISGRTTVKPNSANDPTLRPNITDSWMS
ncbi:Phospholipid metabolism enzyme regulator [Pleurostoma richardsiae]|uniref:Phospholipid metabolism enzyme regulator n=1 Tax=Pleurostoma richardsiae TaxID=41990 RepID=A0AA38VM91_9PEZI|nr:Phospholipid metabolism enzyme regulator [Pleurostoma richardsiae]